LLQSGLTTGFNCAFSNEIHLLREGGKPENCKNDKIKVNQQAAQAWMGAGKENKNSCHREKNE
jgi:hypothetical protein